MRTLKLARVAAQAELLYLRRRLRRTALRGLWGLFALLFLVGALTAGHVAGAMALAERMTSVQAVLAVGAIDLVICVVFAVLAGRDAPDRVEREALEVRDMARSHIVSSAATAALIGPGLRILLRRIFRRRG
jgi:hypothetical protein